MGISKATKVERISSVVIDSYDGAIDFHEGQYARGSIDIMVFVKNPSVAVLDELLLFAQPQENECPPREVTLQSVIDKMQTRRDSLNETWGNDKGQPRKLAFTFTLDPDELKVVLTLLNGAEPSYEVRQTLRQTFTTEASVW